MRENAVRLMAIVEKAAPVLRGLEEAEAARPRLSGGWSAKQVVGHLIDSASNNHQRFVRAAISGSLDFPNYDQEAWSRVEDFQEAPWSMLVEGWTGLNQVLSHVMAHLPAEAAGAQCRVEGQPEMTLEELSGFYISHLVHHLEQLGAA